MNSRKRFYRSRTDRFIGGICGGLAEYFNLDTTIVRLGFIIISLLPGPSIIFYLIAWVIVPLSPRRENEISVD